MIISIAAAGAHADAWFRSALAWSSAGVNTECPGDLCSNSDWNIAANTSVSCASAGTCPDNNPCSANAWALGRNNWSGALRVRAQNCGSAGTPSRIPAQATQDTMAVTLQRINSSTLRITLIGIIGPGSSPPSPPNDELDWFSVKVWKFGIFGDPEDTFDPIPADSVIWRGSAALRDDGSIATSGALSEADFTPISGGYSISKSYDIAYAGADSVVGVAAEQHSAATAIPTLSEWGLVILAVLLLGISAAIIARRRLGAAAA